MFDPANGHAVWMNGANVASNTNTSGLTVADGGAIGRGLLQTTTHGVDPRFRGDIAEVIVYDEALDDGSRVAIESYLARRWGN